MAEPDPANPAEIASKVALDKLHACIDAGGCFVLEAGAGAGKTYSLIDALQRLLAERGAKLIRDHQQIACITYTNVAKDEIEARTDRHLAIHSDTIHGFCWSILKDFQPHLRSLLPSIEKWPEAIGEAGGLKGQWVEYDLGFLRVDDAVASLRHDDVLALMVACLAEPKFRRVLTSRYPILFIDEYQDTDAGFVEALKSHFLDTGEGPLIGLFGDEWQKIYGDGCGKVAHPRLTVIGKQANFRSTQAIVDPLNRMRPDLIQMVRDPKAPGEAIVFHTNAWKGQRQGGSHWKGDVSPDAAHAYLEHTKAELGKSGWNFDPAHAKILMLTHNILAKEQGYASIAAAFRNNDAFIKKEDPHIAYLVDIIEPACAAFVAKRYGAMFEALGTGAPPIASHGAKLAWAKTIARLLDLREIGDVGQVLDHLRACGHLRLPEKVEDRERDFAKLPPEPQEGEVSWVSRLRKLRAVPYGEIIALDRYIDGLTPFATKHGVKGAEFENVLVVVGRGWNQYNFEQMLCWFENGIPADKQDAFVRNRNLFYVACSRPRRRLAVLFTQELSQPALTTLTKWFGADAIRPLPDI
ncbi:ATP-dependent helicase [Rhodospirillaceae bacterium SYSU D60014]|uniref:UvrD-helicase domain-containing protein n=1 Tax=Virgifigura deserti TaxID=2268457 RepID=UPI000E665FF9